MKMEKGVDSSSGQQMILIQLLGVRRYLVHWGLAISFVKDNPNPKSKGFPRNLPEVVNSWRTGPSITSYLSSQSSLSVQTELTTFTCFNWRISDARNARLLTLLLWLDTANLLCEVGGTYLSLPNRKSVVPDIANENQVWTKSLRLAHWSANNMGMGVWE